MDDELAIQASKSYYLIMDEVYFLVEECAEGGYTARALGFPIFTQAETLEAIRDHIKDAVDCHFEGDKPKVLRLHIVHDEILANALLSPTGSSQSMDLHPRSRCQLCLPDLHLGPVAPIHPRQTDQPV